MEIRERLMLGHCLRIVITKDNQAQCQSTDVLRHVIRPVIRSNQSTSVVHLDDFRQVPTMFTCRRYSMLFRKLEWFQFPDLLVPKLNLLHAMRSIEVRRSHRICKSLIDELVRLFQLGKYCQECHRDCQNCSEAGAEKYRQSPRDSGDLARDGY